MLDVNVWLPTTVLFKKQVKHGIFGPLLASESKGEKVGHANLTLSLDERSELYAFTEKHFEKLNPTKTLNIVPVPIAAEGNRTPFAPKIVKSNEFTHSFWPKTRPSVSKVFITDPLRAAHLRSGQRGVEPEFEKHEQDMLSENDTTKIQVIQHQKPSKDIIQAEKNENIDFLMSVNQLDESLEQRDKLQICLKGLQKEHMALTAQVQELHQNYHDERAALILSLKTNASRLEILRKQVTALHRTQSYIYKMMHPDTYTLRQLETINYQLEGLITQKHVLEMESNEARMVLEHLSENHATKKVELERALQHNEDIIKQNLEETQQLDVVINGRDRNNLTALREEWRQRVEHTSRKEKFLLARERTEGKHPDYTIRLPTTSDGLPYCLNEIEVLRAMQEEHHKNYDFIFYNCSTSVKRCLLAGITQPLRDQLREAGLPESFFKLNKIETCKSLRTWAKTLEAKLIEFNLQAKPVETEDKEILPPMMQF